MTSWFDDEMDRNDRLWARMTEEEREAVKRDHASRNPPKPTPTVEAIRARWSQPTHCQSDADEADVFALLAEVDRLTAELADGERTYAKRWRQTAYGLVEREMRAAGLEYLELLYARLGDKADGAFACGKQDRPVTNQSSYNSGGKTVDTLIEAVDALRKESP